MRSKENEFVMGFRDIAQTMPILSGDHEPLLQDHPQNKALQLAIPTPDHFLPLSSSLGLKQNGENISM
jgi:4,5-DOPA dioxygenase extradiol